MLYRVWLSGRRHNVACIYGGMGDVMRADETVVCRRNLNCFPAKAARQHARGF